MIKLNHIKNITLVIAVMISYFACDSLSQKEKKSHNLLSNIKDAHNDTLTYDVSTEEALYEVKKVLAEVPSGELIYIPERHSLLKSFPCSNCHSQPLVELQKQRKPQERKAHWDIKLVHADESIMNCATCHDSNDLDQLTTLTSTPLLIDHSYKLCGQCHSKQLKDWVGGAHGKRLGGWAPPRTINTCVNCHNPHSPAFESRWPARLNTFKLNEQKTN